MNDRLSFPWPNGAVAAVSITFDDTRPSQLDLGIPVLDTHGIGATFYANPDSMEARADDWGKAAARGHEMGNHTVSHPCSGNFCWARGNALEDYTLERMESELRECNERIRRALGIVPKTFAYPCGQTYVGRGENLKSYIPLVAKMFLAGRGFMAECMNDPQVCDLSHLTSFSADHVNHGFLRMEADLKALVEHVSKEGGWLILTSHDVAKEPRHQAITVGELDGLCRILKDPARGIWTATVADAAKHLLESRGKSKS